MDEVSGAGVPDFAGSIVAACQKFIPVLVETAVSERQNVTLELFGQLKLLLSLFLNFLDQF